MKTKKLKHVFFILSVLAIIFIIACSREFIEPPQASSLTVAQAKSWFLTREIAPVMMLKSSKAGKRTDCTPDWEHAFASNNDDYEVVEAPITSQIHFSFSTEESMDLSKKNNEPGFLNSSSHFIVQKNKRTGLQEGYIMTIIGDADYLKAKKFQISNNSYLRKDKDFSGYVLFHDIDGNFVNGWQYKNGKVSGSMTLASPNQSSFKLKVAPILQTCQVITVYEYYVDDPSIITIIGEYISCNTSGGGYAGGGNGGGGSGSGAASPPAPNNIGVNFYENKCVRAIYDKLMEGSTLSKATYEFLDESSGDLIWGIGDLGPKDSGITVPSANQYTIDITLDRKVCNTSSGIYIAQVMIHEALHAEMWRKLNSVGGEKGLSPNNFPELFNAYEKENIDLGTPQHNAIADLYRNTIKDALRDYVARSNIYPKSEEEYDALSWAGLIGTRAWTEFSSKAENANNVDYINRTIQFFFEKKEIWENTDCINKKINNNLPL